MKKNYLNFKKSLFLLTGFLTLPIAEISAQSVTTQTFAYTGSVQTFSVPSCVSQVTLEVWGAEGGGQAANANTNNGFGGKGGYSIGTLTVIAGDMLNIYVGGTGLTSTTGIAAGGFNGGGSGFSSGNSEPGAGGGGASDIRLNAQTLAARVIVAGGGGGGGEDGGDAGGHGGGLTAVGVLPASQTAAGNGGTVGIGGNTGVGDGGGGGGGYYGGGKVASTSGGTDTDGGGGGSGYIGGVQNGTTIAGSLSMPSPAGGTVTGRSGNGFVRMAYIQLGAGMSVASTNSAVCEGESVTFNVSGVVSYTWIPTPNFPGSNAATITDIPVSTTSYTVLGTNTVGCISNHVFTATVNPLPVLSAQITPTLVCLGSTATITASGANSYTWNNVPGSTSSTIISPLVSTSYNYSGSSQFGCVTNSFIAVDVNTILLGVSPNPTMCIGQTATLTAYNAVTYTWSTGHISPELFVSPLASSVYTASGIDINGCKISNTVAVTVNTLLPPVMAFAEQNRICKNEQANLSATGANTYTWSYNICNSVNGNTLVLVPDEVVYCYTVTGTGANGCTNKSSVSVIVTSCTGLNELNGNSLGTLVYPNPASAIVTLEMNNDSEKNIEVMELTGRVVYSKETSEKILNLSLENFSGGIYYFRIRSAGNVEMIKVVKN